MGFIEQAFKGKNNWWRYLLTLLFTITGWQILGIIPLTLTAFLHSENIEEFYRAGENNFIGLGINNNLYLLGILLMFAIGFIFLLTGIRTFHKRSINTVVTARLKFDWSRFFYAFALWSFFALLFILFDYLNHPSDFVWNFNLVPFFLLVIISIVLMPFQTSFEEILFRGYLMQGVGILSRNRWVPLLLSSVIFGLLHAYNPEIEKLGYILIMYYIGTGLLFGMVTLLDEGLELSMGMHAANNIVASIFITTNWTVFQTDALFIDQSEPNLGMLMYIPLFIIYPIILFLLYKKYKWHDWVEKLTGKVVEIE